MSQQIPTTAAQADTNLTRLEAALNQTTPANDLSFNRILAGLEAAQFTVLYKFGVERAKQCLAITATREDLELIALNYGVTPKGAVATVLTFTLPAVTGVVIPVTTDFVGDTNGVRYSIDSEVTAVAGVATITATAQISGTAGNLAITDTLTIGTQVSGAEDTATVTVIETTGVDAEKQEALRVRILDKIRTSGGGGDSTDYRSWAQETPGVLRAYPWAGNPTYIETGLGSTFPGDRTIYIEADPTIDSDGIPPGSLLTAARAYIRFDPDNNNRAREPLPLGDSTLWVEPIIRTGFNVTVTGLIVSADLETQTKLNITAALTVYFANARPFLDGLDAPFDKNNVITEMTLSEVIQNVVGSAGGTFTGVGFDIGATGLPEYTLGVNELAKLNPAGVTYA